MAPDPTALCSTNGPKNTRPPKTPLQETNFTKETDTKNESLLRNSGPELRGATWSTQFLLLKATETKCPYRSLGGYAWAVVGKKCATEHCRDWLNLKKPCRRRFGSPYGRANLALKNTKYCTKSAIKICVTLKHRPKGRFFGDRIIDSRKYRDGDLLIGIRVRNLQNVFVRLQNIGQMATFSEIVCADSRK